MAAADTVTMMCRDYVDENSKMLIDLTYQATRLARTMRDQARKWPGGPAVNEYFVYAGAGGGAHPEGARWTNRDHQVAQQFRWTPRYMRIPVTTTLTKLRVTNAPNAYRILDDLETKISNAFVTLGSYMELALFLPGSGVSWADNINGFPEVCSAGVGGDNSWTGTTYGTYGELDRANANYGKKIKGNVKSLNNTIGHAVLERTYTKASVGGAHPTIGYTTPLIKSDIKMQMVAQQRYQEVVDARLGFVGIRFNEAMIMESRYCPGSELSDDDIADDYAVASTEYATTSLDAFPTLTSDQETFWWFTTEDLYMHYYIRDDRIMGMGMQDFIPSGEHDVLASAVRLAYIFACPGPRYQYEINNIKAMSVL